MAQTQKRKKQAFKAEAKFDLHGLSVDTAFHQCESKLQRMQELKYNTVEVITGKSGQIRAEFPFWMENFGYRAQVSPHGGSFIVFL